MLSQGRPGQTDRLRHRLDQGRGEEPGPGDAAVHGPRAGRPRRSSTSGPTSTTSARRCTACSPAGTPTRASPSPARRPAAQARPADRRSTRRSPARSTRRSWPASSSTPTAGPAGVFEVKNQLDAVAKYLGLDRGRPEGGRRRRRRSDRPVTGRGRRRDRPAPRSRPCEFAAVRLPWRSRPAGRDVAGLAPLRVRPRLRPARSPCSTTPPTRSSCRATARSSSRSTTRCYAEARDALAPFAELEKSPEHIHTYRLTPLSLWNAAAAGHDGRGDGRRAGDATASSRCPPNLPADLRELVSRYGRVRLRADRRRAPAGHATTGRCSRSWPGSRGCATTSASGSTPTSFADRRRLPRRPQAGPDRRRLPGRGPGRLHRGRRAADRRCATIAPSRPAVPRPRLPARWPSTSSTPAATSAAARASSSCPAAPARRSSASPRWPLLQQEHARPDHQHHRRRAVAARDPRQDRPRRRRMVAEYTGESKEIAPVTLATYQIVTYRPKKDGDFPHFKLFDERDWGLIIYDEVHLLPAPVFRVTAEIQARRRLGLTATLVREDGREEDVFSLIGPEEVRRALARAGAEGLDRRGAAATRSALGLPGAAADGVRRRRVARQVPPRQREPGQGRRRRARCSSSTTAPTTACSSSASTSSSSGGSPSGSTCRSSPAQTAERRARGPLRPVPPRRGPPAGPLEGRQLRHRPAGRQRADPGLGHVRQPAGGGAAARPHPPAQGGRRGRPTSTRW